MNYQLIYDKLISKARARTNPHIYCEKHDITPRCVGGEDKCSNLVYLTAREHFIAHWMLTKIYPLEWKLYFAFFQMTKKHSHERILSSRQFEAARKSLSEGAKIRYKMGMYPRKTDAGRRILSEKMKGDNNPMRKYPDKNHTARPHTVFFNDGSTKTYEYGKKGYRELNISRSSWINAVRTGNPLPSFNILKIVKHL